MNPNTIKSLKVIRGKIYEIHLDHKLKQIKCLLFIFFAYTWLCYYFSELEHASSIIFGLRFCTRMHQIDVFLIKEFLVTLSSKFSLRFSKLDVVFEISMALVIHEIKFLNRAFILKGCQKLFSTTLTKYICLKTVLLYPLAS